MDDAEGPADPPPGFLPSDRWGPFTSHNGPIFHRVNQPLVHGFRVSRRHCNSFGIVHGGMLATFLDGLLGHAVSAAAKRPGVTIHLSLDYLSMARTGDWVEGESRITRVTRDVAFAEATARVGEREVIRATAIFKLMDRAR